MATSAVKDGSQDDLERTGNGDVSPPMKQSDNDDDKLAQKPAHTLNQGDVSLQRTVSQEIQPLQDEIYNDTQQLAVMPFDNVNETGRPSAFSMKRIPSLRRLSRRMSGRLSSSRSSLSTVSELNVPSSHPKGSEDRATAQVPDHKNTNRYSASPQGQNYNEHAKNGYVRTPGAMNVKRKEPRSTNPDLGDRLRRVLTDDTMNERVFVPLSDLNSVITQTSVEQELSKTEYIRARLAHKARRSTTQLFIGSSNARDNAVQTGSSRVEPQSKLGRPVASFQRIFAILLLIDRPKKIWAFVREGICDADLPLYMTKESRANLAPRLQRTKDSPVYLKCLRDKNDIPKFVEHQWEVLAPVFQQSSDRAVSHFEASDKQSLPFVYWKSCNRWGRFGEVYKATLHCDHYKFEEHSVTDHVVAVKKLHIRDTEAFKCESSILNNLRRTAHEHAHLVTLLATYEQRRKFYLILPWAEGDLEWFWEHKDLKKSNVPSSWLVRQCQGIVEALSRIHRYDTTSATSMPHYLTKSPASHIYISAYSQRSLSTEPGNPRSLHGRHGDIRPKNILWFSNDSLGDGFGTLKLSDFGSVRFSDDTKMTMEDRETMPRSETYRSPECQLPDGEPSVQCDVWALGCVFLEFLCWYHKGWEGLRSFARNRREGYDSDGYFTIVRDEKNMKQPRLYAKVKEPVNEMVSELRELSDKIEGFEDILDRIQTDMLVVQNKGLGPVQESDESDNTTEPNLLRVQKPVWQRRKSSGNIARDLGSTVEKLADRKSFDSAS